MRLVIILIALIAVNPSYSQEFIFEKNNAADRIYVYSPKDTFLIQKKYEKVGKKTYAKKIFYNHKSYTYTYKYKSHGLLQNELGDTLAFATINKFGFDKLNMKGHDYRWEEVNKSHWKLADVMEIFYKEESGRKVLEVNSNLSESNNLIKVLAIYNAIDIIENRSMQATTTLLAFASAILVAATSR